jgi:hypothetical protein
MTPIPTLVLMWPTALHASHSLGHADCSASGAGACQLVQTRQLRPFGSSVRSAAPSVRQLRSGGRYIPARLELLGALAECMPALQVKQSGATVLAYLVHSQGHCLGSVHGALPQQDLFKSQLSNIIQWLLISGCRFRKKVSSSAQWVSPCAVPMAAYQGQGLPLMRDGVGDAGCRV